MPLFDTAFTGAEFINVSIMLQNAGLSLSGRWRYYGLRRLRESSCQEKSH